MSYLWLTWKRRIRSDGFFNWRITEFRMNLRGAIYRDYGVSILWFRMWEIRRYPPMPILRCRTTSNNKRQRYVGFSFLGYAIFIWQSAESWLNLPLSNSESKCLHHIPSALLSIYSTDAWHRNETGILLFRFYFGSGCPKISPCTLYSEDESPGKMDSRIEDAFL